MRLNMNEAFLGGNATRDAELKTTADGKQYYRFTIACGKAPNTLFLDCTYWVRSFERDGQVQPEVLEILKGDNLFASGQLRQYKNNEQKTVTCLTAFRVQNLSRNRAGATQDAPEAGSENQVETASVQTEQVPF